MTRRKEKPKSRDIEERVRKNWEKNLKKFGTKHGDGSYKPVPTLTEKEFRTYFSNTLYPHEIDLVIENDLIDRKFWQNEIDFYGIMEKLSLSFARDYLPDGTCFVEYLIESKKLIKNPSKSLSDNSYEYIIRWLFSKTEGFSFSDFVREEYPKIFERFGLNFEYGNRPDRYKRDIAPEEYESDEEVIASINKTYDSLVKSAIINGIWGKVDLDRVRCFLNAMCHHNYNRALVYIDKHGKTKETMDRENSQNYWFPLLLPIVVQETWGDRALYYKSEIKSYFSKISNKNYSTIPTSEIIEEWKVKIKSDLLFALFFYFHCLGPESKLRRKRTKRGAPNQYITNNLIVYLCDKSVSGKPTSPNVLRAVGQILDSLLGIKKSVRAIKTVYDRYHNKISLHPELCDEEK